MLHFTWYFQSGELAKKLAQSAGHNTGASQSWAGRGGSAPSLIEDFPTLPGAAQGHEALNLILPKESGEPGCGLQKSSPRQEKSNKMYVLDVR